MRWIQLDKEQRNVPVLKNVVYALNLVWKADKRLILGYLLDQVFGTVFSVFIRNILFLKVLLDIITGSGSFRSYALTLILFTAVSVIVKVISWYGNCMEKKASKNVLKVLNNKIFAKAQSLDVSCYEDPAFYDKYQRATFVLTRSYFDLISYSFCGIIAGIISMLFVIGTVTAIDPAYLIFLLPVFGVFMIETAKSRYVFKRDIEMTTNERIKAYIQRTMFLRDYSKDIRTSNIFAVLMKRFEAAIDANVVILRKYGFGLFLYSMASTLFEEFIPVVGTYAYAGYEFIKGSSMTISGFSVALSSINAVRDATMNITECLDMMNQMALYFQNLKDFFNFEPKIVSGEKEIQEFETLEFRNVSFRYPGAKKNSINNVSFTLRKGETIAIVGVNGAGKSTLVKLMLRFYDPTEGEILYNGVNIKEYNVSALRNAYGAVFQDYKNFAVSVYENVMCHTCTEDEKKLAKDALIRSGVWGKISSFEKEGDTVLTREFDKDGAGLSGGENQKVSTARLFARDFELAILDEPSSALDPVAEYKMYENLIDVTKDKTVIYISHRLSSAVLSDRIIVLGGGAVTEEGTHEELMAKGGQYAEMFTLQASSYKGEEDSENV